MPKREMLCIVEKYRHGHFAFVALGVDDAIKERGLSLYGGKRA